MSCSARTDPSPLPLALSGALLLLAACGGPAETRVEEVKFPVKGTDFRVTVVEGGSLESESPGKIFNEIEGQITILKLIPEGTIVKEGEWLCDLDVSGLVDRLTSQKIQFEQAVAAKIRADNEFEIVTNQQDSLVAQAELDVKFAEIDREKYLKGDFVQAKQKCDADITIAQEEIKRADEKVDWSRKLQAKGFLTRIEKEADELAAAKCRINLDLAKRSLTVLEEYSYNKEKTRLESELVEARRQLERTKARAASAIAQAEADKKSKSEMLALEESRQRKLENQIAHGELRAKREGLVVYAREGGGGMRSNERPIEEGAAVRERQAIISLPDLSRMMAKVAIHESAIDKIRVGQPAVVRLDAFPNDPFPATVTKVSRVPDSQNMWMNPDLKVYSTEVRLAQQDPERLRPGMSCSVEIVVDDLKGVLAVPLQAVHDNGTDHFCFVEEKGIASLREVKVGLHNDRLIHVTGGLREGEVVYLTLHNPPPLPKPRETDLPAPAPDEPAASGTTGTHESEGEEEPRAEDPPASRPASRPRRGGPGRASMSEEERQKMRERFEAMSPEEREAAMQRMREARGGSPPGAGEDTARPKN